MKSPRYMENVLGNLYVYDIVNLPSCDALCHYLVSFTDVC
jgi:hypothetical protein